MASPRCLLYLSSTNYNDRNAFALQTMLATGRCGAGAQNVTENRALALMMAREYIAAVDPLDKALIFRTLLLTGCAGSFNALFSGDGFTYTGTAREAVSCVCRSLQADKMRLQDQTGHCNIANNCKRRELS